MLQSVAECCSVLQCVAVCCSVLQCVAVCCGVLQCVAVCCSVLQFEWHVGSSVCDETGWCMRHDLDDGTLKAVCHVRASMRSY